MAGVEEITERPLFALEEQLARQKGILANSKLLQKLPDKGAKVRDSVAKIEAELERRRKHVLNNSKQGGAEGGTTVPDVAKLEWVLRTTSLSSVNSSSERSHDKSLESEKMAVQLDSDDDLEEEDVQNKEDNESTFKLIATSQITQRQAKQVISADSSSPNSVSHSMMESSSVTPAIDVKPDLYLAKLVEKDGRRGYQHDSKFVPGKSLKQKPSGSSSPALSAEGSGSASTGGGGKSKWDEALLPLNSDFERVKLLSMEDTIKISCDKYKQAELIKATAPPKKTYAYDKLKDQGLLGSYTVEMQTSRSVRFDIKDADEDDLSDDSITEDSESEDSDDDGDTKQNNQKNSKTKPNRKTGKDLSKLLNTSLKLS